MRNLFFALGLLLMGTSCSTSYPLFSEEKYLTPMDDAYPNFIREVEPVIRPGDKITVSIWGHENLSIGSVNSSFSSNEATGKWLVVNPAGETNLPQLGRLKLAGLTVTEATYLLEQKYGESLKDPVINLRVLSHFVTILGEVNAPGKYPLDNEQVTLVELIGLSQGLSPYAKNDQIEVIRSIDGQVQKLRVNLRELVGLQEKNILIQPGDIVYVAPEQLKVAENNLRKAGLVASILTGAAVIYSVIFK